MAALPAAGGGDGQQSGDGASTSTRACWDAKNEKYQARVLNSATGKWECHGRYGTEQAALAAAAAAAKGKKSPTAETLQCPCCGPLFLGAASLKQAFLRPLLRVYWPITGACIDSTIADYLHGRMGGAGTLKHFVGAMI